MLNKRPFYAKRSNIPMDHCTFIVSQHHPDKDFSPISRQTEPNIAKQGRENYVRPS